MIKKLSITNFRGIAEGEVELSPLTILVGANNSGKTALLEALFLAPNPFRNVPYGGTALNTIGVQHRTLESEGYASLLLNYLSVRAVIGTDWDGIPYEIEFEPKGNIIQVFVTGVIDGKKVSHAKMGEIGFGDASHSFTSLPAFLPNSLLINPALLKRGYEYLRNKWASVMNSGICERVIRQASSLSAEKYINMTIEPFFQNKQALYAFREDGRRIRLGDLGEGIQSYIVAKILYELENPGILLWDDIESHLNPKMLSDLSGWFAQILGEGKQVILATHSLETVRIINELNRENTTIVLLSLRDNRLTTKKLSVKEFEEIVEAGIDVRIGEPFVL